MSDNYEKVALGGGVAVALALAFFGWRASSVVEEELVNPATGGGKNDTAVPGAEQLPGILSSMQGKHSWEQAVVDERPLDLFTGIALFARKDSSDPVDLWKDKSVHDPIPNRWFLDNRIDIGFADSPQRDPDGDGFNNLEEFEGGTLPNDPKSHPALVAKLSYLGDDTDTWLLIFSMDVGPEQNQFKFMHSSKPGYEWKMGMQDQVGPGGILKFREEGPADGRFRLVEVEEREIKNERLNITEKQKYAIIEDLKANKTGQRYEIPRRMPDREKPKYAQRDRTAIFELKAAGHGGKTFKVEENTAFALPPEATDKQFKLLEVDDDAVSVEITGEGGQKRSVQIPKGGFPDLKP